MVLILASYHCSDLWTVGVYQKSYGNNKMIKFPLTLLAILILKHSEIPHRLRKARVSKNPKLRHSVMGSRRFKFDTK